MDDAYAGREVRWTRGARKHGIGRGSARHVIRTIEHVAVPPGPGESDPRWWWVGDDERGRGLEVVAVDLPDGRLLVIHVFPTAFRLPR